MVTNSQAVRNASKQNGTVYSDKEKTLLDQIIACKNTVAGNIIAIGEKCDALVKLNGGVRYGDKTLEKILLYPGMNCCRDHLKDCWNYYRFANDESYKSTALDTLRADKPSALFEIYRIADSGLKEEEKHLLVDAVAKTAVTEDQTVNHIASTVTAILKDKGQIRKGRAICPITKRKIQQIVSSFKTVAESEEQFKWFMSNKENRQGIVGMLEELTNYVERIPEYGKDKIINDKIKESAKRLNIVAEKI